MSKKKNLLNVPETDYYATDHMATTSKQATS